MMLTEVQSTRLSSKLLEVMGRSAVDVDFFRRQPAWVQGQISEYDSVFLSGLIQELRPTSCLEIGVASGWSSAVILRSLACTPNKASTLYAIDLADRYYLNKEIPTGRAVQEVVPEHTDRYQLITGAYAFDVVEQIGELDFAFIDAHHMHPWASLDLLAILSSMSPGGWIALHDINLCRIPRHKHTNRGPFYLFGFWPGTKIHSTQNLPMIGAIQTMENIDDSLSAILEAVWTPWEIDLDSSVIASVTAFIEKHYGKRWAEEFANAFSRASGRIST